MGLTLYSLGRSADVKVLAHLDLMYQVPSSSGHPLNLPSTVASWVVHS